MKFNTQLETELSKYEKNLAAENSAATASICKAEQKQEPTKIRNRPSEKVVGGDILWKPIDKSAAMLLAKAPWWAHAPQISIPKIQPEKVHQTKKTTKEKKQMSDIKTVRPNPMQPSSGQIESVKDGTVFTSELMSAVTAKVGKTVSSSEELLERSRDARAALEDLANSFQKSWLDFMDQSGKRLQDMRMFRMAMDTETRQLMASVKDVRQFFLDKDYEKERDRLKEFVELCERLKALKESGFLDTVADTMLGLSEPK